MIARSPEDIITTSQAAVERALDVAVAEMARVAREYDALCNSVQASVDRLTEAYDARSEDYA